MLSWSGNRRRSSRKRSSGAVRLSEDLDMRTLSTLPVIPAVLLAAVAVGPLLPAEAEEWEPILDQALKAEHSQTRQDGVRQVDTSTVKGLKALWAVLAIR